MAKCFVNFPNIRRYRDISTLVSMWAQRQFLPFRLPSSNDDFKIGILIVNLKFCIMFLGLF